MVFYSIVYNSFSVSKKNGGVKWTSFSVPRLFNLGLIVVTVFMLSFGPFIYMGQLAQVLSRLFPFKRGLCHAYWAPNFWALYNVADKVVALVGKKLGILNATMTASMTGGLVQEFEHAALPSVPPIATFVLTVASILPALVHLWNYPAGPKAFIRGLVLCCYGAYMFGWHVHEKAALMMILPLCLLSVEKKTDAQSFLLLSTVGHFSLLPLIFTQAEAPIKYLFLAMFTSFAFYNIPRCVEVAEKSMFALPLLNTLESFYLYGLVPLEIYCSLGHWALGLTDTLPFLPLLITSLYCSLGMTYTFIKIYRKTLTDPSTRCIKVE